jgi:anti-sigma factor RsiW
MAKAVNEADLHAYIDGQLNEERRGEVEAYLAEHPAEAARMEAYREQNTALHVLFDPVLHEPVPDRVMPQPRSPMPNVLPGKRFSQHAAMLAAAVIGGLVGWTLRAPGGLPDVAAPSFVQQAAVAHVVYAPDVRHPVEVTADQEAHLVQWLSRRIGAPLHTPYLGGIGYELMGGRLLPSDTGPAAQFMYQDDSGRRLTLYVRGVEADSGETAFRFAQEQNVGVFYWVESSLAYALSGEVDKPELLRVAHTVYQALNP